MDLLKKELEDQHQKKIRDLTWKYVLIQLPAVLGIFLYVKREEDDIKMLIALCVYTLFTLPIGILNIMKVGKLNKEHLQQMAELDAEEQILK